MRSARVLLVPDQQGSVEHFYHFLLGYLLPCVVWLERHPGTPVTVRDCGPLTPWFDLIRPWADVEVVSPGTMLQWVVDRRQRRAILPPLDDPELFDGRQLRVFATRIRAGVGVGMALPGGGTVVSDRGPADPFYASPAAEVRTAGSERRSVPNMADIARELEQDGAVRLVDAALLAPRDQVATFAAARTLVGQHGAGLAHMVWMAPGSTVVEILPPLPAYRARMFRDLAASLGHRYAVVPQQTETSAVAPVNVRAAASLPPPARLDVDRGPTRRFRRAGVRLRRRVRRTGLGVLARRLRRRSGS